MAKAEAEVADSQTQAAISANEVSLVAAVIPENETPDRIEEDPNQEADPKVETDRIRETDQSREAEDAIDVVTLTKARARLSTKPVRNAKNLDTTPESAAETDRQQRAHLQFRWKLRRLTIQKNWSSLRYSWRTSMEAKNESKPYPILEPTSLRSSRRSFHNSDCQSTT